MHSLTFRVMLP